MSKHIAPLMLVLEDFAPHVDGVFIADCNPKTVELTLVEAYALKDHARLDRPPFILIFRSDPAAFLIEGSYPLRSDTLDPVAIHLVPTTAAPGSEPGYYYQAIFN